VKEVLVVDDSQTVRHEIATALKQAGFAVTEAGDGVSGLERASEAPFVLIILDVNMPRMNGLEMLDQLRLDPKTASIPVVLLTTEAEPAMMDRARKAGAKGWLIKPVPMAHIISTVVALTRRAEA
jgi:two-component system, chemotaxis family, chemotaxis protein CheY